MVLSVEGPVREQARTTRTPHALAPSAKRCESPLQCRACKPSPRSSSALESGMGARRGKAPANKDGKMPGAQPPKKWFSPPATKANHQSTNS
ncbi:hypothetical protein R1flu_000942 [Riccia fluitans]|uniref:Uncharacterized protein n=1 Tax=Riccia fluitans TaxID=41844 RepID=A0ABD1Y4U0_9MARC